MSAPSQPTEAPEREGQALTGAVGSGYEEEIWQQAKREHDAAGKILDALRPVTQNERQRILNYMWDKYVIHPDTPNTEVSERRAAGSTCNREAPGASLD